MKSRPFQPSALMKASVLLILCAFMCLCLNLPSEASVVSDDGGLNYYVFSHFDLRLCPAPFCGGIFVREVNRFLTRCSDGRFRAECYVSGLNLTPLGLPDSDTSRVSAAFTSKEVIIRGSFGPFSTVFPTPDVLVAAEAWEEKGTARPGVITAFFRDNGIRCITEPCPWIDASLLNRPFSGTIAGLDLDLSGATADELDKGYRSLSSAGIIAKGRLRRISGPAGEGFSFEVSRFYLKVSNALFCGGSEKVSCPIDMFCDIEAPDVCSGQDLPGTCAAVPGVCTMIYAPVCGCDGKTYANDCMRLGSRVLLDHTGECTTAGQN